MRQTSSVPITTWLARWRAGDHDALEHIVPLVYDELRRVARRQLSLERPDQRVSPTTLVHETYLRLLGQRQISASDREDFLAVAAQTMRRILVDHARRRQRLKRGGGQSAAPLVDDVQIASVSDQEVEELIAVDSLLERLAALDARAARVVEYRVFAGLTLEETAQALGASVKTVQRTWITALAWLRKEIGTSAIGR